VLGLATDGGWWALGLVDPRNGGVLADVPMSRPDTGERTLAVLRDAGLRVAMLPILSDVDTMADARRVAEQVPGSAFSQAVRQVGTEPAAFDEALAGGPHWLHLDDGRHQELPVTRWLGEPDGADELMLACCRGTTLDIGCGPGRLTGTLRTRGAPVLGIDVSQRAVRLTEDRGGVALHRDVFDPLPRQGAWDHVLLADGNIGIGGDPPQLLRRVRHLLTSGGSAIVEVEPPGAGMHRGAARIGAGPAFPWARVGADALAARRGLRVPAVLVGEPGDALVHGTRLHLTPPPRNRYRPNSPGTILLPMIVPTVLPPTQYSRR